jgi:hypothetical protein
MSEETAEGAIAAVRYFIDAYNLAFANLDASYFSDLGTPDCGACSNFKESIDSAIENEQTLEEHSVELTQIEKSGEMKEGWFAVKGTVKQGRAIVRNSDGSIESQNETDTESTSIFVLDFVDGHWLLKGITT